MPTMESRELTEGAMVGLAARVGEDLESEPLELELAVHRRRISELFSDLAALDHYRLLGLEPGCEADEVHAAFRDLARVVHPSHGERLGLNGKEEVLRVLFERASQAYLVLSDPDRRVAYNRRHDIQRSVEVDTEQRAREKESLARVHYRRASEAVANMEYSTAIDLLGTAVRLDPKAPYLILLGQTLAKNRHWRPRALEVLRRAVETAPEDAGARLGYGELLEELGRTEEARRQYQAAVDKMPDNVKAREGLERLGGAKGSGRLSGLFGRQKG